MFVCLFVCFPHIGSSKYSIRRKKYEAILHNKTPNKKPDFVPSKIIFKPQCHHLNVINRSLLIHSCDMTISKRFLLLSHLWVIVIITEVTLAVYGLISRRRRRSWTFARSSFSHYDKTYWRSFIDIGHTAMFKTTNENVTVTSLSNGAIRM